MASFMYYPNYPAMSVQSNSMATPYHHRSGSMNPSMVSSINGYGCPAVNPTTITPHQIDGMFQPGHGQSNSFYFPPPGLSYMQPPAAPVVGHVPGLVQNHGHPVMPGHSMMMNQPQVMVPPANNQVIPEKEQNVNGGVCEVLDYELNTMSDFVTKNSCLSFGSFDVPADVMELFSSSVSSVLGSTRLPSVTIFLALDYLIKYLDLIDCDFQSIGGKSVDIIYQNLVVALVLANKFNDDKTFTNKSWSQATGMDLLTINQYEKSWLKAFEWRLFEDKFDTYESFQESYNAFVREQRLSAYQQQQQQQQHQLSPSSVPTHQRQYSSASSMAYGYQTPNCGHSSMAYSSPVYSDLRSYSYNNGYQKQFNCSPPSQYSPRPKNYDNVNYYEQPQQPFWNDHHQQQQVNQNYYCFSAY
ncbi:Clg1p [Kluyveromyces lactis]|uniref:KLLA0A01628p n=1 Tax=Kluyveromyces lactis (strain ATCC 8585 / CBS 2359 / DSM 70799 / NBRC 1267 / NRRL Y-1140 / WM37) TaxID=284590 RepID=Q6CYB8_KLULA|nr:uncharacterized protein KLLA0_A01628g [Kluyveromyces lactis]CAH02659.1 KLLA0A01628p [Kluyveromyces lactis]|eukprot:XP_451071.1 uncharacterized protein KLLA0_A01628g [Kluyveromyces lactis]